MTSIEIIQSYYAAFNAGDPTGMLDLLTEEVIHDANEGGSEIGKEAFAKFLDRMDAHYREQVEELVVMSNEDGTRASAEFYINGSYLKTDDGLPEANGQNYRIRVGAFFDLRNGKIARVTNYYNLQKWIEAVSI
ncbi:MAG: ketosteroid isomerase-related protein [Akkermansiaceae bacterium]|jgi:steroid delta-isomerase-like uncharacterized protein